MTHTRIIAFATKGAGTNEEARLRELLGELEVEFFPFDRGHKYQSFRALMRRIAQTRPDLLAMEGTGIAGGLVCLLGRLRYGTRYIFSSGDAVGPFIRMQSRLLGPVFGWYERMLCRWADGFIGWTPYLVGRALTYGTPRAMTAAGWAPFDRTDEALAESRRRVRAQLGIAPDAIVFGIIGSLVWAKRVQYCYGLELVRAVGQVKRKEVVVLIGGSGSGFSKLQEMAGPLLGQRILMPGEIPWDQVPDYLAAMDVASLPQSVDGVGSFRYTTKISEYIAAKVPLITGQIPLSYDLTNDWMWRLPGDAPWEQAYVSALSRLMESVSLEEIKTKRSLVPAMPREFDRSAQVVRTTAFVSDLLKARGKMPVFATSAVTPIRNKAHAGPRKLLSIAHSYIVALNRRLVHEMSAQGSQRWEVTAVAPQYFHGAQDLRPLAFEPMSNEPCRVEVVPTRLSRYVHVFSYGRRLKEVLGEGWDLVHAWEEPYIWAGGQIARWTPKGVPIVYRTAQSLNKWYPPPFKGIEENAMDRAAGWICSGTLVAQTLGARPLYARRPMRLIPLGVDMKSFAPARESGAEILRKLNWNETGPPVVGYLGRFTQAKGLPMLMNVLGDLSVPWRALFVGAGPLERELHSWASRFGDRVRICNDVRHAEVPAYLNAMDVMAAPSQTTPSWREQFGRMLIEAFAAKVPVIGSDSGEIPFVIGSTGVVAPERDEIAWGSALSDLLSNPEKRRDLAEAAHARVFDEFAWPAIARKYLAFFDELV